MPLISNALRSRDENHSTAVQVHDHESVKEERESGYEDFGGLDDEYVDSDMEGSILNRPRPKKRAQAPALPQRSEKRASRILDNVVLELKSLDGSTAPKETEQKIEVSDPHELYLSSEEDASLSDEYTDSESLVDFSPIVDAEAHSAPSSRGSSRKSQEDTARVVSFTIVGKPQIVEISLHSSQQRRHSLALDTAVQAVPRARKPSPLKLYPSALRRLSISSTMSFSNASQYSGTLPHDSTPSLTTLPPRTSSKTSSFSSTSFVRSAKHSFLKSDPFPGKETNELVIPSEDASLTPPTPKTPISMAAAAWKTGISRTLSKARKPSMPKLSVAYTAGVVPPKNQEPKGLGISVDRREEADEFEESDPWKQRQRAATTPQTPHDRPVRYEDIMKGAIRAPPPPVDNPKKERTLSLGMRGLSRRKSIRGKDRYLG